jgi:HAD superfamily hydrolase (TIGR01509 family)
MNKTIIFDIDGVIIDSEGLHKKALSEGLNTVLGKKQNINMENLIGLSLEETIIKFSNSREQIEKIKQFSNHYYLENVNRTLIRNGIEEFIVKLLDNNIQFAFVSSAHLEICHANLNQLSIKIPKNIPVIGLESVTYTKPNPMPYLKIIDLLKINTLDVIVIEDSDTGITSAYKAGIKNIYAWPHKLSGSQKYDRAKKIITSLSEIEI